MADVIISYLQNGGCLYLESGHAFGFHQPSNAILHNLFGISSAIWGDPNEIDHLEGCAETITEGMLFTGSDQIYINSIDIVAPNTHGLETFIESDYGCVSIQSEGTYGQKTFCFSYALAELIDGEFPSTRENLLAEMVNFFELDSTSVENDLIPTNKFTLEQNYPNPFNPETTISFSLNTEITEDTELVIYNIKGQKVKTLTKPLTHQPTNRYSVTWDGTDDNNQPVSSGIYFYRLNTGNYNVTKKMILMK